MIKTKKQNKNEEKQKNEEMYGVLISCFCSFTAHHISLFQNKGRELCPLSDSCVKMQASQDQEKVFFKVKPNQRLGIISLNRPSALNAADLEMTSAIRKEWIQWEGSEEIGTAILRSTSERAFCSGGDVKAMVAMITREPENKLPEKALASEYLLLAKMSSSKIFKVAVIDGECTLLLPPSLPRSLVPRSFAPSLAPSPPPSLPRSLAPSLAPTHLPSLPLLPSLPSSLPANPNHEEILPVSRAPLQVS